MLIFLSLSLTFSHSLSLSLTLSLTLSLSLCLCEGWCVRAGVCVCVCVCMCVPVCPTRRLSFCQHFYLRKNVKMVIYSPISPKSHQLYINYPQALELTLSQHFSQRIFCCRSHSHSAMFLVPTGTHYCWVARGGVSTQPHAAPGL